MVDTRLTTKNGSQIPGENNTKPSPQQVPLNPNQSTKARARGSRKAFTGSHDSRKTTTESSATQTSPAKNRSKYTRDVPKRSLQRLTIWPWHAPLRAFVAAFHPTSLDLLPTPPHPISKRSQRYTTEDNSPITRLIFAPRLPRK